MIFPCVLITAFFGTLNFNNKALYASSDFSNEENYIKIFKYDISKQENIEISVTQDNLLKKINQDNTELRRSFNERFSLLETQLWTVKNAAENDSIVFEGEEETETKLVYVSNFPNAHKFISSVLRMGYDAEIYTDVIEDDVPVKSSFEDHQAICLGPNIPLTAAKKIIQLAYKMYPFLKYIKIGEYNEPDYNYIYIYI
jgi:hypothetical protein